MRKSNNTANNILTTTRNSKSIVIASFSFIVILLFLSIGCLFYFKNLTDINTEELTGEKHEKLNNYYVMITDDRKSYFWKSVYEGAKAALNENSYIEMLGYNLSVEYSSIDLMKIAIDSKVDGIILEADESAEMTALINEANDAGIPVVTALSDNSNSTRKSFVGVNSYNLGLAYGEQVYEIEKIPMSTDDSIETTILVLMNTNADNTSQNIIFSGIQDAIKNSTNQRKFKVETVSISNNGAFAVEESIRDIFINWKSIPNIIICTNDLNTTCVYQEVVDLNKVGKINIIGYDDSDTILKAIERNVIYSTISVDTEQMGMYCVRALEEYKKTGHVSAYFSVNISSITADNVNEYLGVTNESIDE